MSEEEEQGIPVEGLFAAAKNQQFALFVANTVADYHKRLTENGLPAEQVVILVNSFQQSVVAWMLNEAARKRAKQEAEKAQMRVREVFRRMGEQ